MRAKRVRLDQLIVERGLAESRSRAQALLIGGRVRVGAGDQARLDRKPGDLVDPATTVEVASPEPYVSRGGHKLAAALDAFGVDPSGRVCLDVGASTGGFTDVLLQRGARVYAVDVGRGQLAEPLRRDSRVFSLERTNARTLTAGSLPELVSLASVDVSFISLRLVLTPIVSTFAADGGDLIPLVKPQFEAGRGEVGKGGVVRDPSIRRRVCEEAEQWVASQGWAVLGVIESPITGPEGNVEYLLGAVKD